MPDVDLNGIRIHYERRGEAHGTPVVFLHGALAAHRAFAGQLPAVTPERPAYAWDARGHGSSTHYGDPGNPWSLLDPRVMEEDAAQFLAHVVGEPAHVVGVSMGGMLASRLAAHRPHLLRSLTLVSTASEPDPRFVRYFSETKPEDLPEMDRRLFARWHGEPYWRDLAQGLFAKFSDPRTDRYVRDAVRAYRGPALLAFTLDDHLLGPHHVANWQRWLPQAEAIVLPTGGHAFFADGRSGTRALNAALVEFLRKAEASLKEE